MLKALIIIGFAALIGWFFYQGITAQPYSLPPALEFLQVLKFW